MWWLFLLSFEFGRKFDDLPPVAMPLLRDGAGSSQSIPVSSVVPSSGAAVASSRVYSTGFSFGDPDLMYVEYQP